MSKMGKHGGVSQLLARDKAMAELQRDEAIALLKRCVEDWDRKYDHELPRDLDRFLERVK
jgi:hypothetical protein